MKRSTQPKLTRFTHHCQHCGLEWQSLLAEPKVCKRCGRSDWCKDDWRREPGSKGVTHGD